MDIRFIASKGLKASLRAAGAEAPHGNIEICPFQVGDFIAYPGPIALAMQVTQRAFVPATDERPARWLIWIEKAQHPVLVDPPEE